MRTMRITAILLSGAASFPLLAQEAVSLPDGTLARLNYADQNGFNLSQSYGYGDSHADLVWLQLLGNPSAVNPDIQLYRHAQEKRWNVLDWKRHPAAVRQVQRLESEKQTPTEGGGTSLEESPAASHGI